MSKKELEQTEIEELESAKEKKQTIFSRFSAWLRRRKEKRLANTERQLSAEEAKQVEEKLEEVNKEIDDTKTKKHKTWTIIYWVFSVCLILGILIWNALSTDDFTPLAVFKIDYRYILLVIAFVLLMMGTETLGVHRMIYHGTMRSRLATSYKSTAIYRFVPLATGGQPFMISYLTSRDIPPVTALSIPMSKLLFQNLAWLVIASVCLIYSLVQKLNTFISALSIIAFILTLIMVVGIILISTSKKVGSKLVSLYVKFVIKLKIWKDYDKHYTRIMNFFEDYQKTMKEYTKAFFDICYQFLLAAARYVMQFSIPFFIYCAFKGYNGDLYGEFFVLTVLIDLASHLIPIPGGAGINVITFTWLFSNYLGGSTFWALLIWRFCTFYFYLLQGLGVFAYDTLYGNKKYRWIQKKLLLQNESQEFRRVQIENFRQEREKRRKKQKRESVVE